MLKAARTYEEACRTFRWRIPERYNLAFDACDRQTMAGADGHRTALIVEDEMGGVERYTFHVLRLLSNRAANVLAAQGIGQGDRVAVALGPSLEAAVLVLAVLKMGAILVPLPAGLGSEPLAWRLENSGARLVVADGPALPPLLAAFSRTGMPLTLLTAEEAAPGGIDLWALMERASDLFAPALCQPGDAAFILYPDDSGGQPYGAVHAHRAVMGNLPALEYALGFFPQFGDVFWTPADPMSAEALLWGMLAAWHHGVPVAMRRGAFDAEAALSMVARHGVRTAWVPPALLSRLVEAAGERAHALFRAVATGGFVPVPDTLPRRVRQAFGLDVADLWATLATGAVVANNPALAERRPGSPGRAVPGVSVWAIDADGEPQADGSPGELAVSPGFPGAFLGWWAKPASEDWTAMGWLRSAVAGARDLDGYVWPQVVADPPDIVRAGGRTIGLDALERTIIAHSAITDAGCLLVGETIKAFVVPIAGIDGDAALAREIQAFVGLHRSRQDVPGRIEFVIEVPRRGGAVDRAELAIRSRRLDAPPAEDRLG